MRMHCLTESQTVGKGVYTITSHLCMGVREGGREREREGGREREGTETFGRGPRLGP